MCTFEVDDVGASVKENSAALSISVIVQEPHVQYYTHNTYT